MKFAGGLDSFISRRSKAGIIAFCVLLIAAITTIDYLFGQHFSSALFYSIPVMLAAWFTGRVVGTVMSVLASTGMLLTDWVFKTASHPVIGLWNAIFPFFFFIVLVLLLTELRAAYEREARLSRTDALTGLYNRRHFYEIAGEEIERARRYSHPLSLAFIDLDNFKKVNDTLGHAEGDEVLEALTGVFNDSLRKTDSAARFGGDEFAVVFPEAGAEESLEAVSRIRKRLAEVAGEKSWPVTLSVGLVTYHKPPGSIEDIVGEADALMYKVKESGKDRAESKVFDGAEEVAAVHP